MFDLLGGTHTLETIGPEQLTATLAADSAVNIAAVCLTHINFKSGLM